MPPSSRRIIFATVLLQYLYDQPDCPLIFRGGTCIGKVYADFYRLSEDLDFLISTPPEASISVRRKRMAPVREWVKKISEEMSHPDPPRGLHRT